MPGWIAFTIDRDELDLDHPGSEAFRTKAVGSRAELLDSLETGIANARHALESTTDGHLLKPWAFKVGGNVVSQQPRHIMITDAVFSHLAHHRGQLTVLPATGLIDCASALRAIGRRAVLSFPV